MVEPIEHHGNVYSQINLHTQYYICNLAMHLQVVLKLTSIARLNLKLLEITTSQNCCAYTEQGNNEASTILQPPDLHTSLASTSM